MRFALCANYIIHHVTRRMVGWEFSSAAGILYNVATFFFLIAVATATAIAVVVVIFPSASASIFAFGIAPRLKMYINCCMMREKCFSFR